MGFLFFLGRTVVDPDTENVENQWNFQRDRLHEYVKAAFLPYRAHFENKVIARKAAILIPLQFKLLLRFLHYSLSPMRSIVCYRFSLCVRVCLLQCFNGSLTHLVTLQISQYFSCKWFLTLEEYRKSFTTKITFQFRNSRKKQKRNPGFLVIYWFPEKSSLQTLLEENCK